MMMLDCVEGGAGTCRNADALEEAEADLLSVRTALANMIDERDDARADVERLRAALEEIKALVSWHVDTEADPSNQSPEDMTAHINGLVWQLCQQK